MHGLGLSLYEKSVYLRKENVLKQLGYKSFTATKQMKLTDTGSVNTTYMEGHTSIDSRFCWRREQVFWFA